MIKVVLDIDFNVEDQKIKALLIKKKAIRRKCIFKFNFLFQKRKIMSVFISLRII